MQTRSSKSLSRDNVIIVFFAAIVAAGVAAHVEARLPDLPAAVPAVSQYDRSSDEVKPVVTASLPLRP